MQLRWVLWSQRARNRSTRYLQISRWQFGADSSIIPEFRALRVKALKNVGFSVLASFAVCSFPFFSIWFSPFQLQKYKLFFGFGIRCCFQFFQLGFRFSASSHLRPNLSECPDSLTYELSNQFFVCSNVAV